MGWFAALLTSSNTLLVCGFVCLSDTHTRTVSQMQQQLQSSHTYYTQSAKRATAANQRADVLKDVVSVQESAAALASVKTGSLQQPARPKTATRGQRASSSVVRSPRAKSARPSNPSLPTPPTPEKDVVSTVDHSFVPASRPKTRTPPPDKVGALSQQMESRTEPTRSRRKSHDDTGLMLEIPIPGPKKPTTAPNTGKSIEIMSHTALKPSPSASNWVTIAHGPAHHDNVNAATASQKTGSKAKGSGQRAASSKGTAVPSSATTATKSARSATASSLKGSDLDWDDGDQFGSGAMLDNEEDTAWWKARYKTDTDKLSDIELDEVSDDENEDMGMPVDPAATVRSWY